jgi:hypothetical protein
MLGTADALRANWYYARSPLISVNISSAESACCCRDNEIKMNGEEVLRAVAASDNFENI